MKIIKPTIFDPSEFVPRKSAISKGTISEKEMETEIIFARKSLNLGEDVDVALLERKTEIKREHGNYDGETPKTYKKVTLYLLIDGVEEKVLEYSIRMLTIRWTPELAQDLKEEKNEKLANHI